MSSKGSKRLTAAQATEVFGIQVEAPRDLTEAQRVWREGTAELARAERAKATKERAKAKIAAREAQVARLSRKVKALTTRLKRAKRSLGALRRAHPELLTNPQKG